MSSRVRTYDALGRVRTYDVFGPARLGSGGDGARGAAPGGNGVSVAKDRYRGHTYVAGTFQIPARIVSESGDRERIISLND